MKWIKKILSRLRGEQDLDKLIKRGLKVGTGLTRMGGVIIDPAHCWHISIGNDVWIGHYSQIIAHDASLKPFLGYTRIANVQIGNQVFMGAGTIVLPGVTIGDRVVIGAGSVVSRDIPANSVAVGQPARVIASLDEYLEKQKIQMNEQNKFDASYTLRNPAFSAKEAEAMTEACRKYGSAFVE